MVDVKDLSCVEMTKPEEKECFLVSLYHISQAIEGCPCLLRGDRRSDGFFWLLFLAAEKK